MLPPTKKFGARWKSIVAREDDWADECRAKQTAFSTTERMSPIDTIDESVDRPL